MDWLVGRYYQFCDAETMEVRLAGRVLQVSDSSDIEIQEFHKGKVTVPATLVQQWVFVEILPTGEPTLPRSNAAELTLDNCEEQRVLMTESETASYIRMSRSYLRQSRMDGARKGHTPPPPFIRVGRSIRYDRADLNQWLDDNRKILQLPED